MTTSHFYVGLHRIVCLVAIALFHFNTYSQSFDQSQLDFNGQGNVSAGVTSLMFGPDGRLYVAEYPGLIKILTITRNSSTDYEVTAIETLNGVKNIPNHDDDGTNCSGSSNDCNSRETTGITVAGTASNPVIYVSSSDFRIGAGNGGGNGDVNLDTNSGIITRFTWTGSSWDVVDIVRGLPRSEENHATNGLEVTTINGTEYLIVASGGNTNAGAPSTNFVYLTEYALAAAVLAIDLDMLNSMQIKNDNGRQYIYDIPTLDDPTRDNVHANGSPASEDPNSANYSPIDINDPWGGNDGLNQAMVVQNGPVQILSPGYRNAYDLVVTESGGLYVTDNGANGGWGGFPPNEGTGNVTNDYDPSEPGSQSLSGNEQIDNKDHLQLVTTNLDTYTFGSLYGGHPTPVRANPGGAGLFTAPAPNGTSGAVFRTQTYDPNGSTSGSTSNANIALPANWPPVPLSMANPVEGDWRGPTVNNPDGPEDNPVVVWGTNTNGIDEYTASNFGGAMQGNLLAGDNNGILRRVELNGSGGLGNFTANFLSGIGGNPLGVTCNGDLEIFPGSIWTGTLNGKIVVFEPADFVNCINPGEPGYDANADYDNDGYPNNDEEDNFTDPCNGGSQPDDFDKAAGGSLLSDLNDLDDDADGISDATDPFQLGDPTSGGSDAFTLPISNDLFNDQQGLGGIFGLGLTGLMNNGNTAGNWLDWIDRRDDPNDPNPNDVLGGAPGLMTSHMTSGTALGTTNTQEKGYQYGVEVDNSTGRFIVSGGMNGFTGPLRLYGNTAAVGGELGFFIGDGTQSNYIKFVVNVNGFTALQEINDVPQTPIQASLAVADRPSSGIRFYFNVDPSSGQVGLEYEIDNGPKILLGTIMAQGSILQAIQNTSSDLAVGFIGTSNTPGVELEGTWDFLNVAEDTSPGSLTWTDKNENENYTARHENSFVQAGNKFYLMGGREQSRTIDVYDYSSDSWTALVDSAPLEFNHFQATEYQGLIWVIGSFSTNLFPNELPAEHVWMFNPANQEWIQGPQIPANRRRGSAGLALYNNKFYVLGGNNDGHDGGYVAQFDEFDPATGNWTVLPNMPRARDHFAAVVIGNKLYAAGGRLSGGTGGVWKPLIAEVDVYDFGSGTWSTLPAGQNIPTPRAGNAAVNFNNKLLVMGGEVADELVYGVNTDDALKITEQYDPVSQSWERLDDMNFERHGFQAIVSGPGVHVTAGSHKRGGGNQKNMEFLGQDNPVGTASVASVLGVPGNTTVNNSGTDINLNVNSGNVGVFIDDIELTGPDASEFSIVSGQLANALVLPNSTHIVNVVFNGSENNKSANLLITYNGSSSESVSLSSSTGGGGNVVWLEDFEGLANGTENDNGATAWTAIRSGGVFEVENGAFRVSGGSPAGVWTSEVISIGGAVTVSLNVDDVNTNKENVDFIRAYYILDGGAQVQFGEVTDDLASPVTLTSPVISGSTVQIVIEGQVSAGNEIYLIDNVAVTGSGGGTQEYTLTVNNGDGDGSYAEGIQVVVTADLPPSGQQFDSWTGDVAALANAGSPSTTVTIPASDVTITATYSDIPPGGGVVWLEDFEGLSNGTVVDNGATAWSATRDGGVFEVENGVFRVSGGSPNPGVWTSEVIAIGGAVTLSLDVDDINTNKENVDFIRAYYILDGGPQTQFGEVKNDLPAPVTLTSPQINGSTVQIIIEGQVSANNEIYLVDNVTVNGSGGGTQEYTLTVNNGSGDGSYVAGAQVVVTADAAPSGQQFDSWTGDVSTLADPGSASTTVTMPTANLTITATYSNLPPGGNVVWLEDFENLSDGAMVDNGATAWSATRDGGFFDVQSNAFEVRGGSPNPGVWTSEVIGIAGASAVTVSLDIDDINTNKENADFIQAFYILDGGAQVQFGEVKNDLPAPVTLTSPAIMGNTVQIVIEGKVSANNEIYRIDNVTVNAADPPGNQPPVAIATASTQSGVAPLAVDFTGSNSTDDVGVVSYAWDFKDGNTSTAANPSNTFAAAGTYDVELTVMDVENEMDTTTITITVTEPGVNQPPVAIATASTQSGVTPLVVDFTGSNSTDDVGVVAYSWDFKDGNTSTAADPSNTFTAAGTYDVELTVTDVENESDTTTISITVSEPGTDGVISLTLIDAVTDTDIGDLFPGQQLDFGSAGGIGLNVRANTNPAIVGSVAFQLTGPVSNTRTESAAPYALFGDASGDFSENNLPLGNYVLTATAYNGSGQSGGILGQPLVINFSIVDNSGGGNQPPTAVATASTLSGTAPLLVSFTGSNSTDDVGIVSYAWDFKDGNTSTAIDPSNTFTTAGTYDVELTVTDAENATDTTTLTITVNEPAGNQPPTAIITASTQSGTAPLLVDFTGSNSIDDVGVVSYAWDFKDGNTSTMPDPSNTFAAPGTYEVELIVTDIENATGTETITITVNAPGSNQPPVVTNPGTQNSEENDVISLQIVASDESTTLDYQATGLPPNLSIDSNSGLISGTIVSTTTAGSFLEQNGLVMIEAESGDTTGWDITNLDNATGIIANTNSFGSQNGSTITYDIAISTPGVYRFNWRSFYSGPLPTEENDNWVRFANDSNTWFFGIDDPNEDPGTEAQIIANLQGAQSQIVFPKGSSRITASTTPDGQGSNGYFKVYRSGGNSEDYKWQSRTSDGDPHNIYVWFVNPGTYTMEISERSDGHAIDRVVLYKVDGPDYTDSQLDSFFQSPTSGGTQGAAANSPYSVDVTVTDDGSPQEASTITFSWVVGTDTGGGGDPDPPGDIAVESFTLIDADNDVNLFEITDGLVIQESTIQGVGLNIQANTNPSIVGSVGLSLSGPDNVNRNENGAPYTLFGDSGGDYNAGTLSLGSYTLSATPYPNSGLGGTPGQALTVQFSIVPGSVRLPNEGGESVTSVSLSPNPTVNEVDVIVNSVSKPEVVYVYDITGRLVKTMDIGNEITADTVFELDVSGIEEGLYIVQLRSEANEVLSENKLIIKKQ